MLWTILQGAPGAGAEEIGAVTTGQGDGGDGDGGGGLSWLTEAAGDPAPASTAAPTGTTSAAAEGDSGSDWLTIAQSSGKKKQKPSPSATAARPAAGGSAAPGGWMSSGKLGVPTRDDSDEDGASNGAATTANKPKKTKQAKGPAASAASGPGGWLNSGRLGVPAEDESDGYGSDGSIQPVLVTIATQTEDDVDAVTLRKSGPVLPPWAKPWTPPSQPKVVPDAAAPEPASEKEVSCGRVKINHDRNFSVALKVNTRFVQLLAHYSARTISDAGSNNNKKSVSHCQLERFFCRHSWVKSDLVAWTRAEIMSPMYERNHPSTRIDFDTDAPKLFKTNADGPTVQTKVGSSLTRIPMNCNFSAFDHSCVCIYPATSFFLLGANRGPTLRPLRTGSALP